MKLTFALILFFNLQAIANVYSQTTVTVNFNSADFKKVLSAIERQSSYHFVYSERKELTGKKISINVENEEVTKVLGQILANTGFTYSELQNHLVVIAPIGVQANAFTVKGKVVDEKGEPLPGASVKVKGTTIGTVTRTDGTFSIDVPEKGILLVSYIGYLAKEVAVNGAGSLSIALTPAGNLTEVVVTALGIKREARSLGYSDQKVSGADITKADAPNISSGLLGKVAGLNITIPNGVEGSSSRIIIRGNTSLLGNNQPLIVVDGVMVDNSPIMQKGANLATQNALGQNTGVEASQGVDYGSFLNTINPEDVQDINVLKGPTAAALYGARGANGVILITSKKGGKQKGLGITYSFSMRENNPYRYVDLQNEYGFGGPAALWTANPKLYTDGSGNPRPTTENDIYTDIPGGYNFYEWFTFPGDGLSWGPKFTGQSLVDWDGVTRPYSAQPNNLKSFYKNGTTYSNNIAFSGGGDIGTIRVSYTRNTNDAITYNSSSNQNVFNVGSSLNITSKLKAEATISYTNLNRLNVPDVLGSVTTSPAYISMYGLPRDYVPIEKSEYLNADGSKNLISANGNYPYPSTGSADYWWNTYKNSDLFTQNQFLGSLKLSAEITPWLSATAGGGLDYYTNEFTDKKTPTDVAGLQNGFYSHDLSRVGTTNLDGLITAHKNNLLKDFDASISLGTSYYQTKLYDLYAANPGPFAVPFLYNLSNWTGTNISQHLPTENRSDSEIGSVFGIANFAYKKYLFLELTGRNDWSSTLPASNLSFFYPSANLSFVFTDAFDMGSVKNWLDYGKIRVSEARSASGYIPYQTAFNYNQANVGGYSTTTVPSILPSLFYQPQQSVSTEIGTSLSFFGNRFTADFTYYNINSTNQIIAGSVATSSGADKLTINSGALRNRGFEFILGAKVINTKSFKWDIAVNGAHNKNLVVSLAPGVDQYPIGGFYGGNGVAYNAKVGDDYGTIYGYGYVYKNGQPIVDLVYAKGSTTDVIGAKYETTPGYVKIGNSTPKLTGGISNTFNYKNFSLFVMTDFKVGGQIYSADYATLTGQGELPETTKERNGGGLPYTYPDGTKANVGVILPGVMADGSPNTTVVNYMWKYAANYQSWSHIPMVRNNAIFTDSYGKLREVTLSYKFPDKMLEQSKVIKGLTVSIIGRDLFYLFSTLPDHLSPEATSGTSNVQGMQWLSLPGVRSFGFSVKASI